MKRPVQSAPSSPSALKTMVRRIHNWIYKNTYCLYLKVFFFISRFKNQVFAAAILVIFLAGTAGFPVSRSRPSNSRKLSTTVDTSSLMSTGSYLDHRHHLVNVGGRLLQQNVNVGRNLKVGGSPVHPLLTDSHQSPGSDVQTKGLVHKSAGVYDFPLHDDSIPSETEAIVSIQVTKQDIHKSAGFTIEQKDNAVDGNFLEYNNELQGAIQTPWSSELHPLPMEGFIQPEDWLLVKDFIMDDYLFGELDESAREYFLQRILSGLIMSQQTR